MAQVSTTRVENLGRNLRALIQRLVVETRKNNFKPNSPETQNLLKNFASQAHTYQVAARNAGKKFNKAAAEANIKNNKAAAAANAAAAAAAVNVESAAAGSAEAAKANATPSALRARLINLRNKASGFIKTLKTPKPAAPVAVPSALNITNVNKYFMSQPSAAQVNANKRARGAKKGLLGGWTYPIKNKLSKNVAQFWTNYNAKNKNLENKIKARNFENYIGRKRNIQKNIAKYPKAAQFLTQVATLTNLNAKRNALLAKAVASDPASIEDYRKEIASLVNTYRTYVGYTPANLSIQQLNKKSYNVVNQKAKNANTESFKRAIAGGLASYTSSGRKLANNRLRYGARPRSADFAAFWTEVAAANLNKAKAKAQAAASKAMMNNTTVNSATAANVEAKAALAEARMIFKNTNQLRIAKAALAATEEAAQGAAQGLVLAKRRAAAMELQSAVLQAEIGRGTASRANINLATLQAAVASTVSAANTARDKFKETNGSNSMKRKLKRATNAEAAVKARLKLKITENAAAAKAAAEAKKAANAAAAKAAAEAKKAANAAAAKAAAEAKAAAAAQAAANARTAAEAKKARNAQEAAEKAVRNAAAAQAKAVANAAQAQQDAAKKKVREFVLKLWPLTKGNFRGNQWQARITEPNYIKREISKFNPGLTVSQRNAIIANIIQAGKNKAIGHWGPYGAGGQNKNITQRLNRARALVNIVFPPLTAQEAAVTKIAARWRGGAARNNLRKKAVANAFKAAPTRGSALASIASSTGSP
jgi:hypothetical protein